MWSYSFLFLALCSGIFVEKITATSVPATCGPPANITHGHYHYETHHGSNDFRAVIRYDCDHPFWKLSHPNHAIYLCCENFQWSNMELHTSLPTCVKAIDCGPPPSVTHATYKYITPHGDNTYLAVVQYHCDGHGWDPEHVGDDVYVCTLSGIWENMNQGENLPTCRRRRCNEPTKIENGRIDYVTEGNDNSYQSVIKYTCNKDYMERSYSHNGYYSCDADQHWYNTQLGRNLTGCVEVVPGIPLVPLVYVLPPHAHIVPEGASPWSVLIVLPDSSIHNGFLISDQVVLTSLLIFGGQDITPEQIQGMKVYLGVRNDEELEKANAHNVTNVIYEAKNNMTKICLAKKVDFGNNIVPFALSDEGLATPGSTGFAIRWSKDILPSAGNRLYVTLQSVEDKAICLECLNDNYPQDAPDFKGLFCTRAHEGSPSLGPNDDGVALEIQVNGTSYAAGLLSSLKRCKGDLEVFLDISYIIKDLLRCGNEVRVGPGWVNLVTLG